MSALAAAWTDAPDGVSIAATVHLRRDDAELCFDVINQLDLIIETCVSVKREVRFRDDNEALDEAARCLRLQVMAVLRDIKELVGR